MSDDRIDQISKELEFVKSVTQDSNQRLTSLETSMNKFVTEFSDHLASDRVMTGELTRMANTLERNTLSLVEHMRRTDLAEVAINHLKEEHEELEERVGPLEGHQLERQATSKMLRTLAGAVAAVASLASVIYTVAKILNKVP